MREDQKARLAEIAELLAEEFISEADPREWPGAGVPSSGWTQQERGDRLWTKRNAVATGAVLRSLADMEDHHNKNQSKDPETQAKRDDDLDRHISKYEAEAAKLLDKVQAAGRR